MNCEEQLRREAERRLQAGVHPPERVGAASLNSGLTNPDLTGPGAHLRDRLLIQEHELQVHQIELEIQNEELRRANLELERAHNRYADLFAFAPTGSLIVDEAGLITQINLAGAKQLGAARQQLLGRRLSIFVAEPERLAFAGFLARLFGEPQTVPGSEYWTSAVRHRAEFSMLRMLRPDGVPWDAQIEGVVMPGTEERQIRAVLTDISDLKHSQREVERLNRVLEQQVERRTFQARQLNEELQTFVYSVTHDMTRPLRQIQGFAELLGRNRAALDERSTRHLDFLTQATRQMGEQMSSMLAFFQSSQQLQRRQPLDLNVLIDEVARELAPEWRGRDMALTWDELPTIEADQPSVRAVFSNLLANAVKFTRPRARAVIHVGAEERGDSYLFSVRDNGVGFEMERSGRLFGVFQRMHGERDFEGQGMGLALVRRIVQRYQGRVWAESVVGEGSVFWVQWPREPLPPLEDTGSW